MGFPLAQNVSGTQTGVTFQVFGAGGGGAVLDVVEHSYDEEILREIVTHVNSGGVQARLATVLDGKGSAKAFMDLFKPPYLAVPGIRAGINGIMSFYFNIKAAQGSPFVLPVMIVQVHYRSAVPKGVEWSFDVEVNSNIGPYLYPSN